MEVLSILSYIFLETDPNFTVVFSILYIIGLWGLFRKSGIKSVWALVPGARQYQLARCAGRENEGRVYSLTAVGMIIVNILFIILRPDDDSLVSNWLTSKGPLFLILIFTLIIIQIVYQIRIASGLIEVYGLRKRWLVFWFAAELFWFPAILWGWSSKYQPQWQVEDIRAQLRKLASQGSATVMDEGLTVNLKERTVTEFFQKKYLLRDIHMSIPLGHMVLLLGGSGAGKTTFLNAVNGYEKANAEVMLNGNNMYRQYKKMLYEVGFVPQSETMCGKDTVYSTLMDAAKLRLSRDIPMEDRKKRVQEVMEIFGLLPVKNNLVEKLSGGQKKRLSISMEFISNPSLFILDEPDSGLDGVMARELFVQLRKIADTGKIVIVITHTPDRVIDLFDDVIVLAKDSARTGRLAFYGSIDDARQFFGRERMEQIVKSVNRKEEGGDGLADEFVMKYAEVQHG